MSVLGQQRMTEYEACDICQVTPAGIKILSGLNPFSYCETCAWMVTEYGITAVASLLAGAPDRRAYFTDNLEWMRRVPNDISSLEGKK